jgi:hypothetical protein
MIMTKYITFAAIAILLSSCYLTKEYPVEYDYKFLGEFEKYESFSFVNADNVFDTATDELIKNTIKNHLELLGYTYEPNDSKFLVNYFYFNDSLNYKGYRQPEMATFIKLKNKEEKQKEEYKKQEFPISDGTFVINFTDKENYSMIWQGYTTDLYKDRIFEDPRKTRIAVISILKEYSYLPDQRSFK